MPKPHEITTCTECGGQTIAARPVCNLCQSSKGLCQPPPRRLNMSDMLRSTRPDPAFHDALDATAREEANLKEPDRHAEPTPWCEWYARVNHCSRDRARQVWRQLRDQDDAEEARNNLEEQKSKLLEDVKFARSINELRPVLEQIIDKLWS